MPKWAEFPDLKPVSDRLASASCRSYNNDTTNHVCNFSVSLNLGPHITTERTCALATRPRMVPIAANWCHASWYSVRSSTISCLSGGEFAQFCFTGRIYSVYSTRVTTIRHRSVHVASLNGSNARHKRFLILNVLDIQSYLELHVPRLFLPA